MTNENIDPTVDELISRLRKGMSIINSVITEGFGIIDEDIYDNLVSSLESLGEGVLEFERRYWQNGEGE